MDPEVVTDQSIEDKIAAAYEREERAGKEPPEPKPEPQETQSEATEEVVSEAETENTEADEENTDGLEEVEYEGEQFRLPPKLKEALLRQKDYTQKSQDVAERGRLLEERQAALQTESAFREQHFAKAVEAHGLQQRLQQFENIDWSKLADDNPGEAIKLHTQFTQLQSKFASVKEEMQGLNAQFSSQMAENRQKAQTQCLQELKRFFPDLANAEKGPALLRQLNDTGVSYGFTSQELASIVDPRMIRVLHAAMQYKKLQSAKPLADKKVTNVKPVQVTASRTSQSSQQASQLAEMKSKAMKSGKPGDVEAFLAARFAKAMR